MGPSRPEPPTVVTPSPRTESRDTLLRAASLAAAFLIAAALAAVAFSPIEGQGQMPATVPADPDMPYKEGFDPDRAIFWQEPNFVPFRNPTWEPLGAALRAGKVTEDQPVMVFEMGGEAMVLVTSQMSYHHVAQGDRNGEPWMVTF
jgi:hypothetical protein